MISVTDIRTFVELQRGLLGALAEQSAPMADGHHNAVVELTSDHWDVHAHGLGYEFRRESDGLTVDAHTGVAKHPRAFDAWRLSVFLSTQPNMLREVFDFKHVEQALEHLRSRGRIQSAPIPRHYVLADRNLLRKSLVEVRDRKLLQRLRA